MVHCTLCTLIVSECYASCCVCLHTERTIAQIEPQDTGPKWSQHCGLPMTLSTAIGDKESWPDQ